MSDSYTLTTSNGRVTVRRSKREHTYTLAQLQALALSDADPIWKECLALLQLVAGEQPEPGAGPAQVTQMGLFDS